MKNLKYILLLLVTFGSFAQFSKTHYIPPLSNSDSQEPQSQYLYISCPSITPVSFQIQEIGGAIITGTVSRDTPYVYLIGTGYDTQLLISRSAVNSVQNNKGYVILAEDLIYVNARLTSTPTNYQAGGLVSKGSAALGTHFRIGAFVNTGVATTNDNHYTFATILATENNTTISFGDIKPGVELINNIAAGNTPANITLNAGESYAIAVEGPNNANRDGLIGASITSDKPIAVNCGSFAGSNGTTPNLDLGMDQIVSSERTGMEYIFIKGSGVNETERPLLIADQNNTEIYLNGSATPATILNAGQYLALDGTAFSSNDNLYVRSSKNIFAFQGIGGSTSQANQNMHFLPPLSCQTPKVINNIPFINRVGNLTDFTGTVCVVTKTGATLTFIINGTNYTLASLPNAINVTGPLTVTGNPDYVTYTFEGLTGNISVFSTRQIYLSYYGSSGAATYGGFYSGFTFKPEIVLDSSVTTTSGCIPNLNLEINSISNFDAYQWYYNGNVISGATSNIYTPLQPGLYKVKASLTECGIDFFSDEIPVSSCPTDLDNDNVNDNIDLDNNNDGITNCTQSLGNKDIPLSNASAGTVSVGSNYSNAFTGTITTSPLSNATPFTSNANGSFVTDLPAGKTNWVNYQMTFTQPISLAMEYVATANASDLLDSNGEYIISCPSNNTITVTNPSDQLLIDTNYDGIFESGVTQFSSFEIRFRLNSTTPLAAGTGTFKFQTYLSNSISFKHKNLSDNLPNKSTFKFYAICIPKDSDNDGVNDQIDFDSDNDGIPNLFETQGTTYVALSNTDTNHDGIDDVFGNGISGVDSDNDGYVDYLDLDSDNDGIYDLYESGSNASDTNGDGVIDGNSFGTDGIANSIETASDSGVLNFTIADSDSDGIKNYLELDSDNDACTDVIEAGFVDANNDGLLGFNNPPLVSTNGVVISGAGSGYTIPNNNYTIGAPITITTHPADITVCQQKTATFTVASPIVDSYEWQVSTNNGAIWNVINNNATYSGANTITLTVSNVVPSMNGYRYRVFLNRNGNSCGLRSNYATLTTYPLPVINTPVDYKQCDNDTDGISSFNLTLKNQDISSNFANETFTYFTTYNGAFTNDNSVKINNPTTFSNSATVNSVFVRVENSNGCINVAKINLIVSATQINASTFHVDRIKCDDVVTGISTDTDGTAVFDFSTVTSSILALLPPPSTNYTIRYFANQADALAELNAISNTSNYRNVTPNLQDIYVRIDSNLNNSCYGLDRLITLKVEALPVANPVNATNIIRHCDDNQDGSYTFNTSTLTATILNGQTNKTVTYYNAAGAPINPIPAFTVTGTQTIKARVTNNSTSASDGPCYDEETIDFIVDQLPQLFSTSSLVLTQCDDEANPALQDGFYTFDTTNYESVLVGTQTGMTISFTLEDGTVLNHLPPAFSTKTQNVVVTLINPINPSCPATTTLNFVVNPIPKIDINQNGWADELVCSNLPNFNVTLNAGIVDGTPINAYTYQWSLNGAIIPGATNYTLSVNTEGLYSVEVKNVFNCKQIRNIKVTASDIAHIQSIEVVDLVDTNSVTITVNGSGMYVYSITDSYGPYQTSNYFQDLPFGIHNVYIKDLNGCGIVEQTFTVVGAPKFFTPNGDGYTDYWNIKGVSSNFYPNAKIYIFDRFGKLLKQLSPLNEGWDGTFNGIPAKADDYWYTLDLEDGRTAKGHFTLKR